MEINLVTVTGIDPILLHHYIKHYKQLGVDNFYIVIWGSTGDVKYSETLDVLKTFDLEVYKDYRDVKIGSAQFLTDIYNEVISTKPNEWWIQADHDEFIVLPEENWSRAKVSGCTPLEQFILEDCVYNDVNFMFGIMLDRIGENGEFSELGYEDNIWNKFPNVGFINRIIRGNDVRGVPILKGECELACGQHTLSYAYWGSTFTNLMVPRDKWKRATSKFPPKIQIHHFKWRREDIDMHAKYSLFGESWWSHENEKVYNYMTENQRIDITDPRFLIERCTKPTFELYSRWEEVLEIIPYD